MDNGVTSMGFLGRCIQTYLSSVRYQMPYIWAAVLFGSMFAAQLVFFWYFIVAVVTNG